MDVFKGSLVDACVDAVVPFDASNGLLSDAVEAAPPYHKARSPSQTHSEPQSRPVCRWCRSVVARNRGVAASRSRARSMCGRWTA